MAKSWPCNAEDTGLIPCPRRSQCRGAIKPVSHNCGAHVLQLLKPVPWSPCFTAREATAVRKWTLQLEKACMQQWRPSTAINKQITNIIKQEQKPVLYLKKKKKNSRRKGSFSFSLRFRKLLEMEEYCLFFFFCTLTSLWDNRENIVTSDTGESSQPSFWPESPRKWR